MHLWISSEFFSSFPIFQKKKIIFVVMFFCFCYLLIQICRFCWHRIRTDENGLCPACRKPYSETPAEYVPLTQAEIDRFGLCLNFFFEKNKPPSNDFLFLIFTLLLQHEASEEEQEVREAQQDTGNEEEPCECASDPEESCVCDRSANETCR
jgi:hypothetical protein